MAAARQPPFAWNWAAFVATYAWLRYRGLHAWSWFYLPVSTPLLVAYALVFGSKDGCAAALSGPSPLPTILVAVLVITWILPPLLADRAAVARDRPVPPRAGARASNAVGLQAFVIVIAFMSAASSDIETYRMRVNEGFVALGIAKTALAEYVAFKGRLPSSVNELGLPIGERYASRLDMARDGTLRVFFGEAGERLAGHFVEARPQLDGGRITDWSCRTDLPDRCAPRSCRAGDAR